MKKFLISSLVVAAVMGSAYAWAEFFPSEFNEPIHRAICQLGVNKRGCCSWHDGVCGCSYGRVVCCDGVLSPTCIC
jgi:hypothetical protein